jgi:hypothetical protein
VNCRLNGWGSIPFRCVETSNTTTTTTTIFFFFLLVEVFWVVTPCRVVVWYQSFRGPCCLHLCYSHHIHNHHYPHIIVINSSNNSILSPSPSSWQSSSSLSYFHHNHNFSLLIFIVISRSISAFITFYFILFIIITNVPSNFIINAFSIIIIFIFIVLHHVLRPLACSGSELILKHLVVFLGWEIGRTEKQNNTTWINKQKHPCRWRDSNHDINVSVIHGHEYLRPHDHRELLFEFICSTILNLSCL